MDSSVPSGNIAANGGMNANPSQAQPLQNKTQTQAPAAPAAPVNNATAGPAPTPPAADALDFLASFDPLQAHVLQLVASAGLTNPNAPPQPQQQQNGQSQQQTQQLASPPFYFLPQNQQQQQQIIAAPAVNGQAQQPLTVGGFAPLNANSLAALGAQEQQQQQQQLFFANGATTTPVPAAQAWNSFEFTASNFPAMTQNGTASATVMNPNTTTQTFAAASSTSAAPLQSNSGLTQEASRIMSPNSKKRGRPSMGVPSVVSASTAGSLGKKSNSPVPSSFSQDDFQAKPDIRKPANWSSLSAEEKRRYERNMREQQRSYQISQQIKELRGLLTESHIPFKPNKFSILLSVAEYIKQLQARAIMLDAEHRKLVTTIRQTRDMVSEGQTPEPEAEEPEVVGNDDMLFVQGLNYREIFSQCSAALGVAALDGRIIDCNEELQTIFGCSREDLLSQSIFNLIERHDEVFKAMGDMLKSENEPTIASGMPEDQKAKPPVYWCGLVASKGNSKITMNITLARTSDGAPKFFNFVLTET